MPLLSLPQAIRIYLDEVGVAGRTPATVEQYAGHLARWQAWRQGQGYAADVAAVSAAEVRQFFAYLVREAAPDRGRCAGQVGKLAPRTIQGYRRTLAGFWHWARRRGLLSLEQHDHFARGSVAIPAPAQAERPAMAESAFRALLAAAGDGADEESARNRAILWLLWDTGARVCELARLATADVELRRGEARVLGKGEAGGKPGMLFWTPRTGAALRAYLRLRRGPLAGPLLRGCNSRNQGDAVTPNLIRCLVKRLAAAAGVELPPGSPCHSFRHAFARRLRARGLSKAEVGDLLRDSTPAVIDQYLGLDVEPRRALYRRAHGLDDDGERRQVRL